MSDENKTDEGTANATLTKQAAETLLDAREKALEDRLFERLAQPVDNIEKMLTERKAPEVVKTHKGSAFGRYVQALAYSNNNIDKAKAYAEEIGDTVLAKAFDRNVQKGLRTNDFDAGGSFVPEDMSDDYISVLRARSVFRRLQPRVEPMTSGSMTVPSLTAGPTAAYEGEATASNASQPTTGARQLVWKKLKVKVPISREQLLTAGARFQDAITDDAASAMATKEDSQFIRGLGTLFGPKGIRYWAASGNVSATDASSATDSANIETDIAELEQGLGNANIPMLRPAFIMPFRSYSNLKKLRDANGNLVFPELTQGNVNPNADSREALPMLRGHPVGVTNNIPITFTDASTPTGGSGTEVYFADFSQIILGETTTTEVRLIEDASYTDSAGKLVSTTDRDEVLLQITARHDLQVRYGTAIAVKTMCLY